MSLIPPSPSTPPTAPPPASSGALQMPLTPDQVVHLVYNVPSLPAVVLNLMQTFELDANSVDVLADKISHDQGLAASALRLANSTFYGMPKQINSMQKAIAVLGINTVRSLVIAVALTSFRTKPQSTFDFVEFWQKTIGIAVGAKHFAPLLHQSSETAFLAGMLHNMGQLVLADCLPTISATIAELQAERGSSICEAEQILTGTDHAAIGAALAAHWSFPAEIVEAVGAHHQDKMPSGLAQVIWLANLLADAVPADTVNARLSALLGLDDVSFAQLVERIAAEQKAICQVLVP